VVVGLAFASADKKGSVVGGPGFASLLTADAKEPGERAAAVAINQFLTLQLFSPTIIINNP
jgi:hypothetical protein